LAAARATFVSTAADAIDLKLRAGSPCVDKGATTDLPVDALDLDDDDNITEALPLDLTGAPRVPGASVDLGAYESP